MPKKKENLDLILIIKKYINFMEKVLFYFNNHQSILTLNHCIFL